MKYVYGILIVILILVSGFIYLQEDSENATSISVKDEATTSMASVTDIQDTSMVVHLTGAIKSPGIYDVKEGLRLYELIERAGGFAEDADEDFLNLAREVFDGEQIHVPSVEDILLSGNAAKDKVNINRDTKEVLMMLTGIGETKAESIIKYREENGPFKKIEDIMMVDGIKEAMFNKIKNDIVI